MKKILLLFTVLWIAVMISGCASLKNSIYDTGVGYMRKRADLKPHIIEIEKHNIAYLDGGAGEVIVLLHGFGADKDSWALFARKITDNYRVIAVDMPGHGESTQSLEGSYTINSQAEILNRIVDRIGLENFHIFGSSMGGAIATRYTYLYPDRVKTLGLMGAAGVGLGNSEFELMLEKGQNILIVRNKRGFKEMMKFVMVDPPYIPWPMSDVVLERYIDRIEINEKIMKDLMEDIVHEEILPEIKVPTFIIWGDEDKCVSVSCVKVFQKSIPQSKVVVMEKTGHAPMFEKPKQSAKHYLNFLINK